MATVLGVIIALGAWLFPQPEPQATSPTNGDTSTGPETSSTASPATGAVATPPSPTAPVMTYLDGLAATARADLKPLPRALASQPEYKHAVAIGCPTGGANDKLNEVSWPLWRNYLTFSTTVRPYSTQRPDFRATVTAYRLVIQPDGNRAKDKAAGPVLATGGTSTALQADVDGADDLVLQVRCESEPDGLVVLMDAGLLPA